MKYAEMHCHSIYSNEDHFFIESLATPIELLKAGKTKELSAIAITDHNTLKGSLAAAEKARDYGVVVIPAMEIDTQEGTQILAYGGNLQKIQPFKPAEAVIRQIQDNGGIAIIAHPFINFVRVAAKNLDRLVSFADGIEVLNYHPFTNNGKALSYAKSHKIRLMTGGSDAHHHSLVGNVVLGFPDTCCTAEDFVSCLKTGDFILQGRVSRQKTALLGVIMFLYTQVSGSIRRFKHLFLS